MDQDLAVGAEQEGIADAVEIQRVDDLHQGVEAQVTADHAAAAGRGGDGDDQLAGGSIHVGFGQRRAASAHGVLVPGAGARIVTLRHLLVRAHGEASVGRAQVGEVEGRGQHLAFQRLDQRVGSAGFVDRLGHVLHQQDASGQPVLDVAGGDLL